MPDEHKNILLNKAKEDFEAAKNLAKLPDFSEEIVLFHCQQAIEKALKAYLDSKKTSFPKTHDLEMLISMCINHDSSFNEIGFATTLTPYAVEIRYDEFIEMPSSEVSELLSQTEKALNFIFSKL